MFDGPYDQYGIDIPERTLAAIGGVVCYAARLEAVLEIMIWALGDCESSDFNAAPILTNQLTLHKKHMMIKKLVEQCTGLRSTYAEDVKKLFKDLRDWTEFRNHKLHSEWFLDQSCSPIQPTILMPLMEGGKHKYETEPVSTKDIERKIKDAVSLVIRCEALISEARQYHEDRRSAASHTKP